MIFGAINFSNPLIYINLILLLILLYFVGNWLYYWIQKRRLGGALDEADFEKDMRKAQIVDLREHNEFENNHILGARNIPYTTFKMNYGQLRKDLPVYLYDTGSTLSVRAALQLKKAGFQKVYWLKKGFNNWSGKTKSKKA